MNDMITIEGWLHLQELCASIGWYTTVSNNHISLHTQGIIAHKTKSVTSALGFIQGYIAGTKEDK